jgi:choline transport protein
MPGHGGRPGHAPSSVVWTGWSAEGFGYPNGFIFVAGMLNGAYSVGTPDATSHIAEEVSNPERNIPIAIALQLGIGALSGFAYIVALMYAINDFDALATSAYPIAEIYRQATGSEAGAIGLLFLVLACIYICVVGLCITCGRTLWALSRDGATPFSSFVGKVDPKLGMPRNATIITGVLVTILGAINVGSTTAFNAFVGSFICMSSASYIAAILPNLLTGRKNVTQYGPFHLKGAWGMVFNAVACAFLCSWFVIYCFPFTSTPTAQDMNYASLLWGGFTILVAAWWFFGARKDYVGPPVLTHGQRAPEEHTHRV